MTTIFIGFDSDEVIFNFLDPLCTIYNKRFNKNLQRSDINDWILKDLIGMEGTKIFYEKDFFNNLPPFQNAIEVLKELSTKHEIFIITTPPNAETASDKYIAFEKWLPFIPKDNILMCGRKELVSGIDVLIDDSPIVLSKVMEKGKVITVAMDRPYNRNIKTDYRVKDFLEIKNLISRLEKVI